MNFQEANNLEVVNIPHPDQNRVIIETFEEKEEKDIAHTIKNHGIFTGSIIA